MNPSVTRISAHITYPAQSSEPAGTTKTSKVRNTSRTRDEVKLSADAEAKLLWNQGESISEIAQHLECTAEEVKAYLGITDTPIAGTS
jgi:hypothetical protein